MSSRHDSYDVERITKTERLTYKDFKRKMKENRMTLNAMHGYGIKYGRIHLHAMVHLLHRLEIIDDDTAKKIYADASNRMVDYQGEFFNAMVKVNN